MTNKVLINQILPDQLFKSKRKNKRHSYTKSKSQFILAYISYICMFVCKNFFTFSGAFLHSVEIYMLRRTSCVISRMSCPLGDGAVS